MHAAEGYLEGVLASMAEQKRQSKAVALVLNYLDRISCNKFLLHAKLLEKK